jgi:KaiC/GvpD/RAD55 family RecA-like ATPase
MRVKTGIEGLDAMLHGGLIAQRPYLVVGGPGAGKTILGLQFLVEGAKQGEEGLFVTLDEPPKELIENCKAFGWNLKGIRILDAIPDIRGYRRVFPVKEVAPVRQAKDLGVIAQKEIEQKDLFKPVPNQGADVEKIYACGGCGKVVGESTTVCPFCNAIFEAGGEIRIKDNGLEEYTKKSELVDYIELTLDSLMEMLKLELMWHAHKRVVIDSLTAIKMLCIKEAEARLALQSFLRFLVELKVTSLLILESTSSETVELENFLARGVIRLHRIETEKGRRQRAISIEKMRGSSHDHDVRPMDITSKGIIVHADSLIF